jgi:hypothetical protein
MPRNRNGSFAATIAVNGTKAAPASIGTEARCPRPVGNDLVAVGSVGPGTTFARCPAAAGRIGKPV